MANWEKYAPVELSDGTFVCQAHHLIVCPICCVDFGFLRKHRRGRKKGKKGTAVEVGKSGCTEQSSDSGSADGLDAEKSSGVDSDDDFDVEQLRAFGLHDTQAGNEKMEQKPIDFTPAMRFIPLNRDDTPETLFTRGTARYVTGCRFSRRTNHRQILVYTDGACSNNGKPGAIGGCAFVFKGGVSPEEIRSGTVSFRLEDRGPTGIVYPHTSNRAELRAVIAALQFREWSGEAYNELVIATDSEYVEKGATEWIAGWVKRGWRTNKEKEVVNRDLWELLFQEIQKFKECPWGALRVMFWRIPRDWNTRADQGAKEAAATGEPQDSFTRICGIMC